LLDKKVVEAVGKGKSPVLPAATAAASGTTFQTIDRKLQHLHPFMRAKVSSILEQLKSEGIPMALYEGFREPIHQQYFYLQGRINRAAIRTDDRPWRSYRQYGLAVTFGVFEDGAWSWKYDDSSQKNWWDRLKTLALYEGLELTGAEPSGFRLAGLTLNDLIAGRYPEGDQSWADNLARAISNWTGEPAAPPLPHTAAQGTIRPYEEAGGTK
jgi:peptidoglycan L-alanyl-D-glutamate endopeptidase CwlK